MGFHIYRDWMALQFVRCLVQIPNSLDYAGGSAFTLPLAMAKCEAELAERSFVRGRVQSPKAEVVGIGAHLKMSQAIQHARCEAAETLLIERLKVGRAFNGITLWASKRLRVVLRRTELGYACLILGKLASAPFATLSVRPSLLQTLLKAWEEYRNVLFFKPSPENLKTYTRVNCALTNKEIETLSISFDLGIESSLKIEDLELLTAMHNGHQIAYFLKGIQS